MAAERRLSIYVARDCLGCATARLVAHEVQRVRPDVRVEWIELDAGGTPHPEVFGVPTYLWEGHVVSLGNPHVAELLARLEVSGPEKDSG